MLAVMFKDLRLISRDRFGLIALLAVPIVVIASSCFCHLVWRRQQKHVFPIVNEIKARSQPLSSEPSRSIDMRALSVKMAYQLVAEENDAAAALILPAELSKRYLAQKPTSVELLTDPAQWREIEAIKIVMLLVIARPRHLAILSARCHCRERNITGNECHLVS